MHKIGVSKSLLAILALALVAGLGRARAQDEFEGIDEEEEAAAVAPQVVMWTDDNFDQWVFGGRNIPSVRARLASLLTLQIEEADRACGLTDAQKDKLRLAGKGDVKHFFDDVAEKKRRFQLVKNDQNKIGEIFQEIQPLQGVLNSGPFQDDSIFSKAIRKTLDDAQNARYDKIVAEKRKFRYRAKVELVVATLDQVVGLRADQRRKFVTLILDETSPPSKYGQYDYYLVMYKASLIPEEKIKPIFDDAQWKLMNGQFQQMNGMLPFLKQNGLIDEDEKPDAKAPAGKPKAD